MGAIPSGGTVPQLIEVAAVPSDLTLAFRCSRVYSGARDRTTEGSRMSMETEAARAELMAIGILAETFGLTAFASTETFELSYDRLRDLVALAYMRGALDTLQNS